MLILENPEESRLQIRLDQLRVKYIDQKTVKET